MPVAGRGEQEQGPGLADREVAPSTHRPSGIRRDRLRGRHRQTPAWRSGRSRRCPRARRRPSSRRDRRCATQPGAPRPIAARERSRGVHSDVADEGSHAGTGGDGRVADADRQQVRLVDGQGVVGGGRVRGRPPEARPSSAVTSATKFRRTSARSASAPGSGPLSISTTAVPQRPRLSPKARTSNSSL